jgi:uncharacterized protein (DUF433 family)
MLSQSQEIDVRKRPMYTIADAARNLHLDEGTLRTWVKGRGKQPAVIDLDCKGEYLSFYNLVEAHILSSIRRQHGLSLQSIRAAIQYVRLGLKVERPLIEKKFATDGVDLFSDHLGLLLNCSRHGQQAIKPVMELYLKQVEWDTEGAPIRLFPLSDAARSKGGQSLIVVSPTLAFGRPVISGSGVPVEELISRKQAGDSVRDLVNAFGLSPHVVKEVLKIAA